ncbi:hypothetical protein BD311DRAFT_780625 [Dichomitus squalens]|uniref:Uncharacterized protein n=1 Tax=Dichomitus squalens TaxID=114155 RepID=A0A4Q9MEB7_9APHY|nr:hypothetical protein BD311DRAFT_780625 [Dichomitus squalens]
MQSQEISHAMSNNPIGSAPSAIQSPVPLPPSTPDDKHAIAVHQQASAHVTLPTSGSGSGSSSSKLPPVSVEGTTLSIESHVLTPDTSITPTPVESLSPLFGDQDAKHAHLSAATCLQGPVQVEAAVKPRSADTPDSSQYGEVEEPGAPTRASIRKWAKATPAGPPRNTPSPSGSAELGHSSSDHHIDRQSFTHSVSGKNIGLGTASGSGSSSGDDEDSGGSRHSSSNSLGHESSGNIADIESGGSASPLHLPDPSSALDPDLSPSSSPPVRRAVHRPSPQSHGQSSTSDCPPPVLVNPDAVAQEQRERLERRHHRHLPHHPHSSRRRHRDRERERRARTSNPTSPANAHAQEQNPPTAPDARPPAAPMRPLRPLQLITGGMDVLEDIGRMLQGSRQPLLRTRVDLGATSPPRRANDVLSDIHDMIRMTRQ